MKRKQAPYEPTSLKMWHTLVSTEISVIFLYYIYIIFDKTLANPNLYPIF